MEDWQERRVREREMCLLWEHWKKASFSKLLLVSREAQVATMVRANKGTTTVMVTPLGSPSF